MRRTLNIGLCGTGIKSILNLRKTLYASGKDPKAVRDKIRFLVIDSHEEDIVKINNTLGVLDSSTAEVLSFKNDEYVHYSAHLDYSSINMTLNQMNDGLHGHLKSWLVKESLSNVTPGGGTGASQIRNVGRYGFFKIYPEVFNLLLKHFDALKQGSNGQADLDVNIICSIAGGTGSGSLLDVILLLNAMKDDKRLDLGGLGINPIIVLPDVFEGVLNKDGQGTMPLFRAKATAYAVLSELDTLGVPNKPFIVELLNDKTPKTLKENFKVEWMPSGFSDPKIFNSYTLHQNSILWNMFYLLSSADLPTETVVNPVKAVGNINGDFRPGPEIANAMYQAIGDFIYIKCDDDPINGSANTRTFPANFLANINNPIGSALSNSNITIGNQSYKFNNLYGSFGISKIYTDNEKLTQVSSLLLLRKYLDFKIKPEGSTKPHETIVNEAEILKGWKITDVVNKLEQITREETVYAKIEEICAVFKNNLDALIEGIIKPEKIFDDNKDTDTNRRSVSNKNDEINISDIMIKSFGVLKEKLETEVDLKVRKVHENAVFLSIDVDPSNNDTKGMSFLESLNDFCLRELEKRDWESVKQCFDYIYKIYFVTHLNEVKGWSKSWIEKKPLVKDKFAGYLSRMQDLKSIPKSQQGIACKAISETLVNGFKSSCEKEILYQIYQAIEFKFLQKIKPYLDPEETSSYSQIIFNATKFLKNVSSDISLKVTSAVTSVGNIKETAFSTPVMHHTNDEIFIEKTMMSAIKLRNQNAESSSFSYIEKDLLDQLHSFPKTNSLNWISPNLPGKSLGAIFLGLVKRNRGNQMEFCAPTKEHFVENLIRACYVYLKKTCQLGGTTVVSNEFENTFGENLNFVEDQVIKKSSVMIKPSATYTNLTYTGATNSTFKYFLSSSDNVNIRNKQANSAYSHFSNDANFFVNVRIVIPLVALDCINDFWPSYSHILHGTNNNQGSQKPIKAEYLHSDFGYFKCYSVPFTPDTINEKKSDFKNITCILIESILLGVVNKSGDKIGFIVSAGASPIRIYLENHITTFGKVLVEIAKRSLEKELMETTNFKYKAIKNILGNDKSFELDIKIEIGLKHLRTKIEENFKQVLQISKGEDINEVNELQSFLLECVTRLERKYNQNTLNNTESIDAKRKYDALLLGIRTAISMDSDTVVPLHEFSSFLGLYCKEKFTDDIYIPVITL